MPRSICADFRATDIPQMISTLSPSSGVSSPIAGWPGTVRNSGTSAGFTAGALGAVWNRRPKGFFESGGRAGVEVDCVCANAISCPAGLAAARATVRSQVHGIGAILCPSA